MTRMTAKPVNPKYRLANEFVQSAKDMGDAAMIEVAVRVWWAVNYPRTRQCSQDDISKFNDWCTA